MSPRTRRATRRRGRGAEESSAPEPREADPAAAPAARAAPLARVVARFRRLRPALPFVLAAVCLSIVLKTRVLPRTLLSIKPAAASAKKFATILDTHSFVAEDGERYMYLDDPDSYTFLRAARNTMRSGSPCDRVVEGECRDILAPAPFGGRMIYGQTLHVRAIVALHRLLSALHPGWPLSESARYVSFVMAGIAALIAFGLGWRLGGAAGAVASSLLVSLQKVVLERSLGGDNDIWTVVFPLLAVTLLHEAARHEKRIARLALAVAAGGVCGLHAWAWRGWPFTGLVSFIALALVAAWRGAAWLLRRQTGDPGLRREAVDAALCAVAFALATAIAVAAAGGNFSPGSIPLLGPARPAAVPAGVEAPFPNLFGTVRELRGGAGALDRLIDVSFGRVAILIAVLGAVLVAFPERPRRRHLLLLAGVAAFWLAAMGLSSSAHGVPVHAAIIVPVALLMIDRLRDPTESDPGPALLVSVWLSAAVYAALGAPRFGLLMAAPMGASFAVSCRWVHRVLAGLPGLVPRLAGRPGTIACRCATFALCAAFVLLGPVRSTQAVLRGKLPRINTQWRTLLERIRDTSPADAIVHTWWDYGYWVKYFAERRVTADGGTLAVHAHHWLARGLISPSEDETVGLLRMLDCAGDALPQPEGRRGAFALLEARLGRQGPRAYDLLVEIVRLDRDGAKRALIERGLVPADVDEVLARTHCKPPAAYLVLSSEQAVLLGWLQIARFDMHRAIAVDLADRVAAPAATAKLGEILAIDHESAARLDAEAREVHADWEKRRRFVTGQRPLLTDNWLPCKPEARGGGTTLVCVPTTPTALVQRVEIDTGGPSRVRLKLEGYGDGSPAVVMLPDGGTLRELGDPKARFKDVTVVLDPAHNRVAVGTTSIMKSVWARLLYLDGVGLSRFERLSEAAAWSGERVVAYRIRWP